MTTPSNHPRWFLRRADQLFVGLLVACAVAGILGWWTVQSGWPGGMVEIDHADPLTARFQVDVNTASAPELMQIPGVGPALSRRIIESRENVGPFLRPDDLRRVRGIGAKILEQIRPYVRTASDDGAREE